MLYRRPGGYVKFPQQPGPPPRVFQRYGVV